MTVLLNSAQAGTLKVVGLSPDINVSVYIMNDSLRRRKYAVYSSCGETVRCLALITLR